MALKAVGSVVFISAFNEAPTHLNGAVAMDEVGNFIATFSFKDDAGKPSILRRQFDLDGNLLGSVTLGGSSSDIAITPSGHIAFATSFETAGRSGISIHNTKPNGSPSRYYESNETWRSALPKLAVNPDGSYFMAWSGNLVNNKEWDVYLQAFNEQGELLIADPILVNYSSTPYRAGFQGDVQVVSDGDGDPIVVWSGEGKDDQQGIYARFDKQSPINGKNGTIILVNTVTDGSQGNAAIAANDAGDVVIVWQSNVSGNPQQIYGQRFNNLGERQGNEFKISETGTNGSPEVVIDADGNFVVAWSSMREGDVEIIARQFNANGAPKTDEFVVNSDSEGRQSSPDIAMDAQGDVIITWQSQRKEGTGNEILGQRYEAQSEIVFGSATYNVKEDQGSVNLEIQRLDEIQFKSELTVNVTGGSATKNSDYKYSDPIPVTFEPGETSRTVEIPVLNDDKIEDPETISLKLVGSTRASTDTPQASTTIAIIDDDQPPVIVGTDRDDTLTGTNVGELIIGARGSDTIKAKKGDDTIYGIEAETTNPSTGKGEIDVLFGGAGHDQFRLGERNAYYNDGNRNTVGVKDYALIKDFNAKEDVIRLAGTRQDSWYFIGSSPNGLPKGNAIYLETGRVDELVAIVQGENKLNLKSNAVEFNNDLA